MKYFIDFEATQFSMEIISVGCVREDGQTFYALVAPKEGKITPFITNLTGITAEMVKTAMTPDSVFRSFMIGYSKIRMIFLNLLFGETLILTSQSTLAIIQKRLKQRWF